MTGSGASPESMIPANDPKLTRFSTPPIRLGNENFMA